MTQAEAQAIYAKIQSRRTAGTDTPAQSRYLIAALGLIRGAADAQGVVSPYTQSKLSTQAISVAQGLPDNAGDIAWLKASARVSLQARGANPASLDAVFTALAASAAAPAVKGG
jgi:hypothetical protein